MTCEVREGNLAHAVVDLFPLFWYNTTESNQVTTSSNLPMCHFQYQFIPKRFGIRISQCATSPQTCQMFGAIMPVQIFRKQLLKNKHGCVPDPWQTRPYNLYKFFKNSLLSRLDIPQLCPFLKCIYEGTSDPLLIKCKLLRHHSNCQKAYYHRKM